MSKLVWPVPEEKKWNAMYNKQRGLLGEFEPPNIYGGGRAVRIETEFPEILEWADMIADAWYGKDFRNLTNQTRRNRIIGAMLYESRYGSGGPEGGRIREVWSYLHGLRVESTRQFLAMLNKGITQVSALVPQLGAIGGVVGKMLEDLGDIADKATKDAVRRMQRELDTGEAQKITLQHVQDIGQTLFESMNMVRQGVDGIVQYSDIDDTEWKKINAFIEEGADYLDALGMVGIEPAAHKAS